MKRYYYVSPEGDPQGPFTIAALRRFAAAGKIEPNTPVIEEGAGAWSDWKAIEASQGQVSETKYSSRDNEDREPSSFNPLSIAMQLSRVMFPRERVHNVMQGVYVTNDYMFGLMIVLACALQVHACFEMDMTSFDMTLIAAAFGAAVLYGLGRRSFHGSVERLCAAPTRCGDVLSPQAISGALLAAALVLLPVGIYMAYRANGALLALLAVCLAAACLWVAALLANPILLGMQALNIHPGEELVALSGMSARVLLHCIPVITLLCMLVVCCGLVTLFGADVIDQSGQFAWDHSSQGYRRTASMSAMEYASFSRLMDLGVSMLLVGVSCIPLCGYLVFLTLHYCADIAMAVLQLLSARSWMSTKSYEDNSAQGEV